MMLIDEDSLKLWHGDWREVWPLDCDAVVTDPPYGIKAQHSSGMVGGGKTWNGKVVEAQVFAHIHADSDKSEAADAIEAMRDVKSQAWFGGEHLYQFFPPEWTWVVWDKRNGASDFADCEMVIHSGGGAVRKFEWLWNGAMRKGGNHIRRVHPNEKPVELMMFVLSKLNLPDGATVFDPFAGSGTVGAACQRMGYSYVGCEIVETYAEAAATRLDQRGLWESAR